MHGALHQCRGRRALPGGGRTRGFTLLETALATVIVGVGVMATMQVMAAGTMSNDAAGNMGTGVQLAHNVRELSLGLPFADPVYGMSHWGLEPGETALTANDLDDLDGAVFSPPINARRQVVPNMSDWKQTVRVDSVDPSAVTGAVPSGSTAVYRVTVTISRSNQNVYSTNWLIGVGN
jgi:prepilin-type N-terminal cleavage/methylation domain-containing protein